MKNYLELCQHVLNNGILKEDRTGTGTISTFGYQLRCNISDGFPLLTTKKVYFKDHILISKVMNFYHLIRIMIYDIIYAPGDVLVSTG